MRQRDIGVTLVTILTIGPVNRRTLVLEQLGELNERRGELARFERALESAIARGSVLALAEAVKVADEVCAKTALAKHDLPLATKCHAAYDRARPLVVAAAEVVDASGETSTTCAVADAAAAVRELSALAGPNLPAVVADALALAEMVRCAR